MNRINSRIFWTMAMSIALVAGLAFPVAAGDEDIFSAQVPPNVMLMVDNSGSMDAIMEHPSFNAASFAYTCNIMPETGSGTVTLYDQLSRPTRRVCASSGCRFSVHSSDSGWVPTANPTDDPQNGYIMRRFCNQTRKLYTDGIDEDYGNTTLYYSEYVEWLYSLDDTDNTTLIGPVGEQKTAPQILAEIDLPANGVNFISGQTFAKYQITRITAARDIARDVIYQTNSDCPAFLGDCGVYEDRVRFGVAKFHRYADGGFVVAEIEDYSSNRTDISNAINALDAQTATPLGETLFKLYTYFMPRDPAAQPVGNNGTQFPGYVYNTSNGYYTSTLSDRPADPVTQSCQKNFIIMITDGEPTSDNFSGSGSTEQGFPNFTGLIGDYAPDLPTDPDIAWGDATPEVGSPPWGSSAGAGYLDDIARWMQLNDCRPDFPGQQVVDVYTVGFGTIGAVNSLLEKTAREGNGLFFSGNQAETLTQALVSSVQDIISKSQGFSAATVPAARTSEGGNLYTTLFQPTSVRPFWPGKLRSYKITAAGEIHDRNDSCALTDLVDPAFCAGGTFKSEVDAPPFWNASRMMPGANSRNLKISLPGVGLQIVQDFDQTITAADLGGAASLGVATAYPPAAGVTNANLHNAVVSFLAGCTWGSGLAAGGGDDFQGCVDRTRVEGGITQPDRLGDIFHSNPVVIGRPAAFIPEVSYGQFANDARYIHRDRVIVAGANDGFLHGFSAGTYDVPTTQYDTGTGVELFGFMPWGARASVSDLAKDDATLHPINVDGSPSVADVWIDRNTSVSDAKIAAEWKTVLIAGMREGAEHYFALDVTDPADANYPAYMWEFPLESDIAWRTRIAETWSQPVITRVRLERSNGDVEEVWVAVVGFGYDPTSDPNNTAVYNAASLKGRGVMMIEIESGRPVAVRQFGTGVGEVPEMEYAMPSTPGVLDYDQDGFADLIYIGDLGGNVWKWVVRSYGTADPTPTTLHQPNWSFRKFFSDDPTRTTSGLHARSFYFAPAATIVSGILHIGLGSGERSSLNCSSTSGGCTLNNRFYVLKDRDIWDNSVSVAIDGRAAPTGDLLDTTPFEDDCPVVPQRGFYFEVPDGEKFVTNSEVFNRFFFTSTFTPDLTNACEPAGRSTLYGFLAKCGQGFFGPPSGVSPIANTERSLDLGLGMPTDARLSIAPGDGGNRLIISKQDGQLINIEGGKSDMEDGQLYWRELD